MPSNTSVFFVFLSIGILAGAIIPGYIVYLILTYKKYASINATFNTIWEVLVFLMHVIVTFSILMLISVTVVEIFELSEVEKIMDEFFGVEVINEPSMHKPSTVTYEQSSRYDLSRLGLKLGFFIGSLGGLIVLSTGYWRAIKGNNKRQSTFLLKKTKE